MVGRDLDHRYPPHDARTIGEELLEIRDWTVYHPADPHRVVVNQRQPHRARAARSSAWPG